MLYAHDLSIKQSREGTRIIQFQGRDSSSPEGNENIANVGEGGSQLAQPGLPQSHGSRLSREQAPLSQWKALPTLIRLVRSTVQPHRIVGPAAKAYCFFRQLRMHQWPPIEL